MPRDGSGVYSAPPGSLAAPNTLIESAKHNALVNDLVQDANIARPITAGGTGQGDLKLPSSLFGLKDATDQTKRLAFDLSGISTGQTRTITVGDADVTLRPQAEELVPGGLIAVQSDAAQVDIPSLAGYRELIVYCMHIMPTVNGASLLLQVSVGGTFNSTAGAYRIQFVRSSSTAVDAARDITTPTGFFLSGSAGNGINGGVSSTVTLSQFNQNRNIMLHSEGGYIGASSEEITYNTMQRFIGTTVRDGIRLKFSTGLVAAGSRIIVKGVRG